MAVLVGLLRAVNVGGTGKIAMAELREICVEAGFKRPETYIQSGNVVFESSLTSEKAGRKIERLLEARMGKPVGVVVRTTAELASVLERNPFAQAPGNRVLILFLAKAPGPRALDGLEIPGSEQVRLDGREVFVHYPDGMGTSKLKLSLAKEGTGRNLNTVSRLASMAKQRTG